MKSAQTAIEIRAAAQTSGDFWSLQRVFGAFSEFLMTSGRILALDLGKRRIGLALSDELGITAQGLETLQRTNIREDLARLTKLASDHNVTLILMGNPIHMSGHEGRGTAHARDFSSRLEAATGLPVQLWDERLTTVQAQRVLRESGISIEKRAKAVDRLAAVILLESFLDSRQS
jgi:putative Holliday junction resolvase